jgi:Zn-dependent protease with chaperone function
MGFVLRRSLPSIGGLVALLLAMGFAAVVFLDAPVWFPVGFAVAILLIQYTVNPWIVQWLVPATRCRPQGRRYDTDHPIGRIVAGRCRAAGIPLVKLGIVDDGPRMPIAPTPN